MKPGNIYYKRAFLTLLGVVLLLGQISCAVYSNQRLSRSVEPVAIVDGTTTGTWQNPEISILFDSKRIGVELALNGTLNISDTIVQSYPVVRYFSLNIVFLSSTGKRIDQAAIPIAYQSYGFAEHNYPLSFHTRLPEQAVSFTFSYQATFADYGEVKPETITIIY